MAKEIKIKCKGKHRIYDSRQKSEGAPAGTGRGVFVGRTAQNFKVIIRKSA